MQFFLITAVCMITVYRADLVISNLTWWWQHFLIFTVPKYRHQFTYMVAHNIMYPNKRNTIKRAKQQKFCISSQQCGNWGFIFIIQAIRWFLFYCITILLLTFHYTVYDVHDIIITELPVTLSKWLFHPVYPQH